jgi:hypothetical protein
MTFSEQTYPVLRMLKEQKLGNIDFFASDADIIGNKILIDNMELNFKTFAKTYQGNIQYITKPFGFAIGKAMEKLTQGDVWNNIGNCKGTILNLPIFNLSVMYTISGESGSDKHSGVIFYFYKNTFAGYRISGVQEQQYMSCYSKDVCLLFQREYQSFFSKEFSTQEMLDKLDAVLYTILIGCINFIKYAKIETKILTKGRVLKDINCKYTNMSNRSINILDSKWFTNLVKSDAFNVRGHFRLQPCGHALSDKKLIWINEFQKTGYTAPARKLSMNLDQ